MPLQRPMPRHLSIGEAAAAYGVMLLVLGGLDAVWLGWLAIDFYRQHIGTIMAADVRLIPAALFYLAYPLALVYLALWHAPATWAEAARRSGVLGLAAFGVYDLTNLATLQAWTVPVTVVDMLWGTSASALAGSLAWLVVIRRASIRLKS